ncbi:MAG: FAD:protein FMN transferase [Bacteroidales bacterium]
MVIRYLGFYLILFISTCYISCTREQHPYVFLEGFTQGTTYHVTYENSTGENYKEEIENLLHEFDLSLSSYIDSSLISRFNRGEEVQPDDYFHEVLQVARHVYHETNGAFDITVGPVVNALGFGSTERLEVDSAIIDSLAQHLGMEKIYMENGTLVKTDPNVVLDVNAIAQGYSVDVVARFLDEKGIQNYMVEIGGEVRTLGKNLKGKIWRIGIDKPVEGNMIAGIELQDIISLKNQSLATSGNYRRFFVKDGVKYTHTIDPATGFPVISRLLSATVVSDMCIVADAYATAFMVMGVEKSIEFVKSHDEIEAYFIFSDEEGDYQIWYTDKMGEMLAR